MINRAEVSRFTVIECLIRSWIRAQKPGDKRTHLVVLGVIRITVDRVVKRRDHQRYERIITHTKRDFMLISMRCA